MRPLPVAVLFCLTLSQTVLSGIGENFEPAGLQIGGSGRCNISLPQREMHEYSIEAAIHPEFGIMIYKNLEAGIFTGYDFNFYKLADNENDYFHRIPLGAYLQYFFVGDPDKSKGPVHSVGLSANGALSMLRYNNSPKVNENVWGYSVTPFYSFYYFISDRLAPFVSCRSSVGKTTLSDSYEVEFTIELGISFRVPRKMRTTYQVNTGS